MADFSYSDRTNNFNQAVGGGTLNDRVRPEAMTDLINLDILNYCGRFQMIGSEQKRPFVDFSDVRPDRPYLFQDDNWCLLAEIYYYLPDILPGSSNKTVGSGVSTGDRGWLMCGLIGEDYSAQMRIDHITHAGTYGQVSVVSASNDSATLNSTGSLQYNLLSDSGGSSNLVLLPSGVSAGDLIKITLWGGTATAGSTGYIQSWFIGEPYTTASHF